ncbi:MAG: VWA domain-containing protein [Lachnospiraceae bacterium]|nr:VWA domain-containing protein [Lachnospiraceae bacterium]
MNEYVRRLPIYLLIDTSGSMMGEPIEAVKQGIRTLITELKGDPQAVETAYLSVITFDSHARQLVPLTELMKFSEPEFSASGATALGEALLVMLDCIKKEVRKNTDVHKGDWRPFVFILTDGSPTDTEAFSRAVDAVRNADIGNIIACAAGAKVKIEPLKRITKNVLIMNTISAGDFSNFFEWVSGSIKMTSKSMVLNNADNGIENPVPQGFVIVS